MQSERLQIGDLIVMAATVLDVDPLVLRRATNIPLAESALAAPYAGLSDLTFYDDPVTRAAILCSRIVRNHPFPDGNKRTGYLALKLQLSMDGIAWQIPNEDDAVLTIEALAAGTIDESYFVSWVKGHTQLH